MDTWATSSLTPQIATGWVDDPDLFERTFPMDLRPQGPEIIRTWLFDTVVRARLEHGALPWTDTTINGWVLDPDRKKMSKSKGNVVTPMPLVEEYGADALRYWACNGRPGVDTAVDFGVMKVGRKLAIKVLNASKFVLGVSGDAAEDVREVDDRARPFAARRARRARRRRDRRVRRVRLRALARTHGAVLLVVLRRLRRAREEPRVRRRRRRRRALGRGHAAHRALDAAAPVRAGAAVRQRRGVVVVARRIDPPRRVAGRRADAPAPTAPIRSSTGRGRRARRGAQGRSRRRRSRSPRPSRACASSTRPERLAALEAARADVCDAGKIAQARGRGRREPCSVQVELARSPTS